MESYKTCHLQISNSSYISKDMMRSLFQGLTKAGLPYTRRKGEFGNESPP